MLPVVRLITLVVTVLLLAACGFHLRGHAGMPFDKIYLDTANQNSLFISDLRRSLKSNNVKVVESAGQADVVLNIVYEISDRQILTLGGSGRVNEFRLSYRVSLHAYDLKQQDWISAEEITLHRDFVFDDAKILAKEAEENMLYQNMRLDMVQQIVRRLSRAKPQQK